MGLWTVSVKDVLGTLSKGCPGNTVKHVVETMRSVKDVVGTLAEGRERERAVMLLVQERAGRMRNRRGDSIQHSK